MKVVEFPKKEKCKCNYVYRLAYKEEDDTYGVMIGKNLGRNQVQELSFLSCFQHEEDAEAAAWGFMEALHYIRNGGEL